MAKNKNKKKNNPIPEANAAGFEDTLHINNPVDDNIDELPEDLLALLESESEVSADEGLTETEAEELLKQMNRLDSELADNGLDDDTDAVFMDLISKSIFDDESSDDIQISVVTETTEKSGTVSASVPEEKGQKETKNVKEPEKKPNSEKFADSSKKPTPKKVSEPAKKTEPKKVSEPAKKETEATGSKLYMVRLALILAAICTAISGMLAVVNHVTKDTIAQNDRKAREAAVLTVFPDADLCREYITPNGDTVYLVAENETVMGYCVNVSPAGYSGNIDMMVGISQEGEVSGIKIVKLSETPGVGTKVKGDSFLAQFLGFDGDDSAIIGETVDGVSGATFSSKAVAKGVNDALAVSFDWKEAAEAVGLKLSDSTFDPFETEDSNADNGDETLMPGQAGEVGETEPQESTPAEPETEPTEITPPETDPIATDPVETSVPETKPAESETIAWVPDPWDPDSWIPDPVIPDTDPAETEAPETEPAETEPTETEAPETMAPETAAPETSVPETVAPETVVPETVAPETAEPETLAPETAAPETMAPETVAPETEPTETEPTVMQYSLSLRAVDLDGNVLTDVLDAKLNGEHWISSAYSSEYPVNIGVNTISGWDEIPEGYSSPADFTFTVSSDGTITVSGNVTVETEDYFAVFVLVLDVDPYLQDYYNDYYTE